MSESASKRRKGVCVKQREVEEKERERKSEWREQRASGGECRE